LNLVVLGICYYAVHLQRVMGAGMALSTAFIAVTLLESKELGDGKGAERLESSSMLENRRSVKETAESSHKHTQH
jgi:hypothetical protein